jgi:hypothetical protein
VSEPTAATVRVIDTLPPYVGETMQGQGVLGKDTYFLARVLLRHLRSPSEAQQERPALETVHMLAPETSEALASFSRLKSALEQLLDLPESDEFGPSRPTLPSTEVAERTLFQLVQGGFSFPEAVDVGTDHDGGLRIVWENGPRFLELVVPHERDAAAYFYYSSGDQYNLQRNLGLDAVRHRFNWLDTGIG